MRIYASAISPFCTRVAIAARAKGVTIESVYPPVVSGLGLKNPEYLSINPIGKIPALVTDDGSVIPESAAIVDYLEDRFPAPSLRAPEPEIRAQMNAAMRIVDTYVMEPLFRTYPHLDASKRDDRIVEQEAARWSAGLGYLAELMQRAGRWPQAEAGVSIADCVIVPSLHLSTRIAAMLGLAADPILSHEVLIAYYRGVKENPLVGDLLDELTAAQSAYDIKAGRPSVADRHL
jgi:glutathione S-transferase